jgi:preprotein translocase subunit SecF
MWLGVKREDLVKSGSGPKASGGPDDPNAGAVV